MSYERIKLVLVSGPSGAGRKTAISVLEDLGYEGIDNLPLSLVERVLTPSDKHQYIAIGLDPRNRDFSTHAVIDLLQNLNQRVEIDASFLYLECETDTLVRRFSETRRRHPIAPAEGPVVGIARERDLLTPIKARADIVLDTTNLTPHELKQRLGGWFTTENSMGLAVSVQSFSYKRGLPREVDLLFDCRFLQNPYWVEELRGLDGRDMQVSQYIQSDDRFASFFSKILDMVLFLLPEYKQEGKTYLSIGFGCTGGQHRSVALAQKLTSSLTEKGWVVSLRHRELERKT